MAKAAAYLAANGLSQKQIAVSLSVSQPSVSRLLATARRERWIITRCAFSPADLVEIQNFVFPEFERLYAYLNELQSADDRRLRSIRLFGGGDSSQDSFPEFVRFGEPVAQYISEFIPAMHKVGVAWGKTLAGIAVGIQTCFDSPPRATNPVCFFPVCGEPFDFPASRFSASVTAAALHDSVNGGAGQLFSLGAIAARIPKSFSSHERTVIRQFIERSQQYNRVFGGSDPLIRCMDCVLTSGGTFRSRSKDDHWVADIASSEKVSHEQLAKLTIGDIGGALLPAPRLTGSQRKRLREIDERWTGISIEDFKRCAEQSITDHTPGVVFVARGRSKAAVVKEVVRLGLVNELLVDYQLAEEIISSQSNPD